MRFRFFLLSLGLLVTIMSAAQSSKTIQYQALARDSAGRILSDQALEVRFRLVQNSVEIYRENQLDTTNRFGLFSLQIGAVDPVAFEAIDWSAADVSLEVDVDWGSGFIPMGEVALSSVPYALFSAEAARLNGFDLNIQNPQNGEILRFNGSQWVNGRDSVRNLIAGQGIGISGDTLFSLDADADASNEIQDLKLTGNILTITKNGSATNIDLSKYLDNTDKDTQQLSRSNDTLFLQRGGFVKLPADQVNDADADASNEIQDLKLTGNILTITKNGSATNIDLSKYLDNTDKDTQQLSRSNDTLFLQRGGFVKLPADQVNDADADASNEIQDLKLTGNMLTITKNGSATNIDLSKYLDNTDKDTQQLSRSNDTLFLQRGGFVKLPADQVNDADADASNEIQDLKLTGNILTITKNGSATNIDLSKYLDNTDKDTQQLSRSNDTLFLQRGGYVKLPADQVNDADADASNEIQDLKLTGNILTITKNGSATNIDLSKYLDNTDKDTQQLSRSNDTLFLQRGGYVKLPADQVNDADADASNEIQDLKLTGNILTITKNGSATNIDLSPYLDDTDTDTDTQQLSRSNDTLFLQRGGFVKLPADQVNDADADASNEIQDLKLTGNILTITKNGSATNIDLSKYLDNTDKDTQQLSRSNDTLFLQRGGFVKLPADQVNDADADASNEIQDLKLTGNILTITKNGSATNIDLSKYLDDTDKDTQQLSRSNDTLFLQRGGYVKLPADQVNDADADASNEIQDLKLTGNMLTITKTGSATNIDLSKYLDNTDKDTQQLSRSNDTLFLQRGGFVKLPADQVNDADADASNEIQDLKLTGNMLTITKNGSATNIDLSKYLDNTDKDTQQLSRSNDTLFLQRGGFVKLPADQVNDADADPVNEIQQLSRNSDTIFLSKSGGYVILPSGTVDTDDQILSRNGDTLFIQDGNYLVIPGLAYDGDSSQSNEIQDLKLTGNILTITKNGSATNIDLIPYLDDRDTQQLTRSNDTLFLQRGGFVKLPQDADTDSSNEIQDLQLSGNTLSITKNGSATNIDLSPYLDDRDTQQLTRSNDTLFLQRGGFVKLPADTADEDWLGLGSGSMYNGDFNDRIGIGTPNPELALTIDTANGKRDGGILALGTLNSGDTLTTQGAGTRFIWYPRKAALRAGTVSSDHWSNSNIGHYSTALGADSKASGVSSFAAGQENYAGDSFARAIGQNVRATAPFAQAIGRSNIASGRHGMAVGAFDTASGDYSLAQGYGNKASAYHSLAFGSYNVVSGYSSFALGHENEVKGMNSVAFGSYNNITSSFQMTIGQINNTMFSDYSYTQGDYNWNLGKYAQVIGYYNEVDGVAGYAMGKFNRAVGDYDYTFGTNNFTNDTFSHAVGRRNIGNAKYSRAIGALDSAYGVYSLAAGHRTYAGDSFARAIGQNVRATAPYAQAIGQKNVVRGRHSMAVGKENRVTGEYNTVFGRLHDVDGNQNLVGGWSQSVYGDYSFFGGHGNYGPDGYANLVYGVGNYINGAGGSVVFGYQNTIDGYFVCAIGEDNDVGSTNSTALGWSNLIDYTGHQSFCAGTTNIVRGKKSILLGESNYSSVGDSNVYAFGYDNDIYAHHSVGIGSENTLYGIYSHTLGRKLLTNTAGETVLGYKNDTAAVPSYYFDRRLFTIGNGTDFSPRNNALVMLRDGRTGLGIDFPLHRLHVVGGDTSSILIASSATTSNGDARLMFGEDDDYTGGMELHYDGDDNVLQIWSKPSAYTSTPSITFERSNQIGLYSATAPDYMLTLPNIADNEKGRARAESWVNYSDGRLKTDVRELPYGLKTVMALKPHTYFKHNSKYIDGYPLDTLTGTAYLSDEGEQTIGFIAQELQKVVPEAVLEPANVMKELYGVDLTKLIPILTKAIQEQQSLVEEQQLMIRQLESRITELEQTQKE